MAASVDQAKRIVLGGTLDVENPLAVLRGNALVLNDVFRRVEEHERFLASHVETTPDAFRIRDVVRFPEPQGLNINMMPIMLHDDGASLPDDCKGYLPLIQSILVLPHRPAKVAYLTIHESLVPAGATQRRAGLHVERPGALAGGAGGRLSTPPTGAAPYDHDYMESEYARLAWGLGEWGTDGLPVDGIYMVSSVDDSCAVYPCLISDPHEVTDAHGGLEHMRHHLPEDPRRLKAGELCWITDKTPHEALPTPEQTPRQFFRLVVGRISVWHAKHNTPNPLGITPDAPISEEDKFQV